MAIASVQCSFFIQFAFFVGIYRVVYVFMFHVVASDDLEFGWIE